MCVYIYIYIGGAHVFENPKCLLGVTKNYCLESMKGSELCQFSTGSPRDSRTNVHCSWLIFKLIMTNNTTGWQWCVVEVVMVMYTSLSAFFFLILTLGWKKKFIIKKVVPNLYQINFTNPIGSPCTYVYVYNVLIPAMHVSSVKHGRGDWNTTSQYCLIYSFSSICWLAVTYTHQLACASLSFCDRRHLKNMLK